MTKDGVTYGLEANANSSTSWEKNPICLDENLEEQRSTEFVNKC